jgi:hypothetical protein
MLGESDDNALGRGVRRNAVSSPSSSLTTVGVPLELVLVEELGYALTIGDLTDDSTVGAADGIEVEYELEWGLTVGDTDEAGFGEDITDDSTELIVLGLELG